MRDRERFSFVVAQTGRREGGLVGAVPILPPALTGCHRYAGGGTRGGGMFRATGSGAVGTSRPRPARGFMVSFRGFMCLSNR